MSRARAAEGRSPGRIVLVNEYYPPAVLGGAELSTEEHARALASGGSEVTVLTPGYGGPRREERDGVRIVRFPFPVKLRAGESVKPLWFQNPVFYLYLAWWTWRLGRRADVVHAQNSFSLVGAYLGARFARRPFVISLRDYMHLCSAGAICLHERDLPPHRCSVAQYRMCFREFEATYHPEARSIRRLRASLRNLVETIDVKVRQWALRRADAVVTVSNAVGSIYRAAGLLRAEPVTAYNLPPSDEAQRTVGNPRERFGIAPNAPLVLYVGKLSFGKGSDVLLRAAEIVRRSRPEIRFLLVGRTNPLVPVPGEGPVAATGALPHHEVLDLYRVSDLVVLPAVWKEPFPRSLLEAMTAGRPVVATRSGGIPELVEHGVSGLLVAPGNAEELAEAILRVLREPELAGRLGAAGRERVARLFSSPSTLGPILGLYQRLQDLDLSG
jgi:glycosyltransferase involved in cell wall biosynthesis